MIEQLKKNMFIGIGLMAMTKDRVKEFGKKLAEDSKLSEAEGEKLVDELLKQAEDMKKYFNNNFRDDNRFLAHNPRKDSAADIRSFVPGVGHIHILASPRQLPPDFHIETWKNVTEQ